MSSVPLTFTQHHRLCILNTRDYPHAAKQNAVNVLTAEFAQIATCYPLFFRKEAHTGNFVVSALLGLDEEENLFCQAGSPWNAPYVPFEIVKYPFDILTDDDGDTIVLIDDRHDDVSEEKGSALFNADGSDSPFLQKRRKLLSFIHQQRGNTRNYIDALQSLNLLQSLSIKLTWAGGRSQILSGLYTIQEETFHQLDEQAVYALFQKRHLGAAYAMINSIGQINRLVSMKNQKSEEPITAVNFVLGG